MKSIIRNTLLLFAAGASALSVGSCSDDDNITAETDRQFMTMFITDYTRGKGNDYPYNSGIDRSYSSHGNAIHLYWYGVSKEVGCAGYQIQMSTSSKVQNGAEAWARIQGTSDLLLDTIIGPDVLDLLLPDLNYDTPYRFAIRVLSDRDDNVTDFSHASNWYGHGNGRQWQEWFGVSTDKRYPTPFTPYVDESLTTETTLHVCINSNVKDFVKEFENMKPEIMEKIEAMETFDMDDILAAFPAITSDDKETLDSYYKNFNVNPDGEFAFKYLMVSPSKSNPNASVGSKWRKYEVQDADRERGYVIVDGLTKNSTYVIDLIDPTVPVAVDAKYNDKCTARTGGTPGAPILLKHDELMARYGNSRADTFALAAQYNAAPISPTLADFINNSNYAEGQAYYLEGGKTYYMDGNDETSKGFVLATDPEDVKRGLRAKVICGIGKNGRVYDTATNGEQWQGSYTMFMFGRNPEPGEGGEIYMKKLAFYDIDFDNPKALNFGDNASGQGTVAGNYFFNMYSEGMAVRLDSLVIENCTFKRIVRGFIREQGPNYKVWNHVLIKGNQFFDCGYYNQSAGGYPWIGGSGTNAKTNLYNDFKVIENTFYDSPFPSFFSEEKVVEWKAGSWNITFSNNTLVNFNTRADGSIFKMRNLPNGSIYNVENNLFVLTKQPGDQRVLGFWGADIRETQVNSEGIPGVVTLNFNNNWSTNDNLTNGSIFSGNPWTDTSNNFGKLLKNKQAVLNGSLEVEVADVSSTELFTSPCPPHKAQTSSDRFMHRADALDGTASSYNVNLYYKNMDNDIVRNGVGDPRWRR